MSAHEEKGAEADGGKHDDAQHRLLMPAHPLLRLAGCEGAHHRHKASQLQKDRIELYAVRSLCQRPPRWRLPENRLLRFIKVFLQVGHEGGATCTYASGIARMGLMLAMNVAVGVPDVNLAKLDE